VQTASQGAEALVRSLAEAAAGRPPLAPLAAVALVGDANGSDALCLALGLSPRQWEVAQLRARGLSEASNANRLGVTPLTVHSHVKRIHAKWSVHDRRELGLRVASAGV
jgi:DNA-binding NarL/FixJ family response regulator